MKYLQFFNESIVEDKILYLKDLCDEFFDEHDDFEFKIINGRRNHSWRSMDDVFDIKSHNDPEKYIFLFISRIDGMDLSNSDNVILSEFDEYLRSVNFHNRGCSGYYFGKLYRFDKHSKMTQNYF
jgi:hypothetical protein